MLYDIEQKTKRNSLNPGFWDQFTNRDVFEDFINNRQQRLPAVNVIENDAEFILELASPGMCRDNYTLEVENDVLNISGNVKTRNTTEEMTYKRREFNHTAFDRSFILPEYVDEEKIAASCADGILTIHIPKKDNVTVNKRREIAID